MNYRETFDHTIITYEQGMRELERADLNEGKKLMN